MRSERFIYQQNPWRKELVMANSSSVQNIVSVTWSVTYYVNSDNRSVVSPSQFVTVTLALGRIFVEPTRARRIATFFIWEGRRNQWVWVSPRVQTSRAGMLLFSARSSLPPSWQDRQALQRTFFSFKTDWQRFDISAHFLRSLPVLTRRQPTSVFF